MKKVIFIAFSPVLFLFSDSMAQGGWRMDVKGGYGLTMIQNLINDPEAEDKLSFGWQGSLGCGYNFQRVNFGFTLELSAKQYAQIIQVLAWEIKTDLRYLELPFLFRLRPAGNKMTGYFSLGGPYLEVGIQPSVLLKATQEVDSLGIFVSETDVKNRFENFNSSAVLGFGFHIVGTHKWAVTHGLRFTYGLMEIRPQTRTISVSYLLAIAYKFNSGRRRY